MDPLKERTMYLFSKISKSRFLFPYCIVGFSQSCWQHTSHEYIMQRLVFSAQFSSPPFQPSSQVSAHRTFKRPSLAFHITQIYWYWQTLISLTSLWEKKKAAKPVPSLLFFFFSLECTWVNGEMFLLAQVISLIWIPGIASACSPLSSFQQCV